MANSLLSAVGPAGADTNTREPRTQLQQTVIRLGLLACANLGAVQGGGKIYRMLLGLHVHSK